MQQFKERNEQVALVIVTKVLGSAPCKVGSKMLVTTDKRIFGTIGGGKLEYQIIEEAAKAIIDQEIKEFSYTLGPEFEQCCGGRVELIIEPMNQLPDLYLCGAGHIGVELCKILKDTPFNIHLLDVRKDWESSLDLDPQINFINADFDLYKQRIRWGPNCYIAIMTHDHKLDFEITALALHYETRYIGLIGSKTKKNKFNNMLRNELNFEKGIAPVHCPIGLDLGGGTPKEIAISIAAELLKEHYGK